MKKCKSFLILLLSFAVLSSCSKKNDDPAPATGLTGTRLKSVESSDSMYHTAEYTYNAENRVSKIEWRDSSGQVSKEDTYEYTSSGLISKENSSWGNSGTSYTYEYTPEGLLSVRKFYGDITQTTLYQTTYFTYNSNKELVSFVKKNNYGTIYRDSTVYLNYTEGYPADMHFYNQPSGSTDLQLLFKTKHTYDSRKNHIKEEITKVGDLNTYELSEERTYEIVNDLGTWIELTDDYGMQVSDNYDQWPVPRSKTMDYYLDFKSYRNDNRYLTTFKRRISEKNQEGLPIKQTIDIIRSMDGTLYEDSATYNFTYETY